MIVLNGPCFAQWVVCCQIVKHMKWLVDLNMISFDEWGIQAE